jgi:hypothetical protein
LSIKTFQDLGRSPSTAKYNPDNLPLKQCFENEHEQCPLLGVAMVQGEVMGTYDCGCSCHETGKVLVDRI